MSNVTGELAEDLGFRKRLCGPHSSRTIMLREVSILFDSTPPVAGKEHYARVIIDENILGKGTTSTRRESEEAS